VIALRLFAVLALIGTNAFFAAVEFSLVAVRHSRIRQLVEEGNSRARVVESLLSDLGRVVSGVQVGITLASLALGYIGEITLADILGPVAAVIPSPYSDIAAHALALILAFGLLTVLQVVLGELVPKTLSLARTEQVALLIARPFSGFLSTFSWAINLLDGFADRIVRLLGVPLPQGHTLVRSVEELHVLIEQAQERGVLPPAEVKFIQNVLHLNEVQARELMVPRPDMHVLSADAGLEETMKMFATTQRSRIPVYSGTVDHIAGFVHIKDLIWILLDRARRAEEGLPPAEFHLRRLVRDVLIVPETKPAGELLLEFRSRRAGLAMVVDEFGSILGLITLEDILEQMVGEIHDEFDVVEHPLTLPDGALIFDGATKLRDLESQYNIALPEDPSYETIGGFVISQLGFIPRGGEGFESNGFRLTVIDVDHRRVSRVKIKALHAADAATPAASPAPHAGASGSAPSSPLPPALAISAAEPPPSDGSAPAAPRPKRASKSKSAARSRRDK
jgi:putative hemolysin